MACWDQSVGWLVEIRVFDGMLRSEYLMACWDPSV